MKNIRKGVFETNSSSTHSLCIKNNDAELDDIPNDKEIILEQDEFGWEEDLFCSFKEKISYIYTYIRDRYYEPTKKEAKEILDNLEYLKLVINEVCPNSLIIEKEGDGYIDHDCELDELWNKFKEDKELLKHFLFCSDSILVTDNDNSCYDAEDYDNREVNKKIKKKREKGYFIYEKGN